MVDYKFGNRKIGEDTLIINMGSATECPSAARGLCDLAEGNKCYALRDERVYPGALPYRQRQQEYWLGTPAETIALEILGVISKKRAPLKFVRWNESGDLHGPDCAIKLITIATLTPKLLHYTYTHRTDLLDILESRPRNLVVQVSTSDFEEAKAYAARGFNSFYTDTTLSIRGRRDTPEQTAHAYASEVLVAKYGTKAAVCKWDCSVCALCKVNGNKVIHICIH